MKHVVICDDIKQSDIKPHDLFDTFLKMSSDDVKHLLIKKGALHDVKCPACNNEKRSFAFKKFGLNYQECSKCRTLYISPRPTAELIDKYFIESKANQFWNEYIIKKTIKSRVEHLVRSKVLWVVYTTEKFFDKPKVFADIRSRYPEFLTGIDEFNLFKNKIIVNPEINVKNAFDKQKSFQMHTGSIKDLNSDMIKANVITCFYVMDRSHNPSDLLKNLHSILADGGLLFLISSTASGLDLQVLWENAKTIFPPENINIFSIEGIKILLEKSGFEIIELSTPGQLDLELIKNAMKHDENLAIPRFISYLIKNRDENAHRAFQNFLQEFHLSSHLRIVARKKSK